MADVEEDGPVEEGSGDAAGGAATASKRFEVKKWNAVGQPAACGSRGPQREALGRTARTPRARARGDRSIRPGWGVRAAPGAITGSPGGPVAGGRASPPADCALPPCAPYLSAHRRLCCGQPSGRSLRRPR